jgi:dTDP-4-dehydrorhamnose 3,5-epimerase
MRFTLTSLQPAMTIDLEPIRDQRGFFARAFCAREFKDHGLNFTFVQSNMSFSPTKGTLRGIHYQVEPHREAKVVRCIAGAIYDVLVDLRVDSPTFLRWLGIELSSVNRTMAYIPEGFGHGYMTLADNTEILYQVSEFYSPDHERGVRWNDPTLRIQWPFAPAVISSKDANLPDFAL